MKNPEECLESRQFKRVCKKLNEVQRSFIFAAIRIVSRQPSGRRYTKEEQIFFLSIYKKSPKAYRYLQSFLPIPGITTLKKLLKTVSMEAGVTEETRNRLNAAGKDTKTNKDKAVMILWDELLLGLGLSYDEKTDKVSGFEDFGNVRTEKFADHGLVFMMRYIDSGDVIPISFYFCDAQTTTGQLLYCIKEVVGAVKDAGFNVVCTVYDGGTSNQINIIDL